MWEWLKCGREGQPKMKMENCSHSSPKEESELAERGAESEKEVT